MAECRDTTRSGCGVVFLARSLDAGGAERQLCNLAAGFARNGIRVAVFTFYPGGVWRPALEASGVRVVDIGKQGRWDIVHFLRRLFALLRKEAPAVLYSLLPVPNIISAVVKRRFPGIRVAWGVRASDMELSRYDRMWVWAGRLEAVLSGRPDVIVFNSRAGRDYHVQRGFPANRSVTIPNGIDTEYFRYDSVGRHAVRRDWQIANDEVLVGIVARLDPMKGHKVFLRAARLIANAAGESRFVCIGEGPAGYRERLVSLARCLGIERRMVWAGRRDDMPAVYSALDIVCSASLFGEGFPNAIAEAMACERVCVVTDVGDSRYIVGRKGRVVPKATPEVLAAEVLEAISLGHDGWARTGGAARQRVIGEFGVGVLLQRTLEVLDVRPVRGAILPGVRGPERA